MPDETTVAIIGAGPAGLTLANLLQRSGVDCVVLEARDRAYVENRQRAGIIDHHAGRIFEEYGLADRIVGDGPVETLMEIRTDGVPRFLDTPALAGGRPSRLVPQQMLVRRLIAAFLDGGGDLRFDAADVAVHDLTGPRPRVTYRGGEVHAAYLAGCDGFHGVSRRSIPAEALRTYSFDHGIGWFSVLADAPPPRYPLMGVSRHGFAAQFARGPYASRFYLQYQPGEDPRQWTDEHTWAQLRLRLGDPDLVAGPITGREVVDMRSFVAEPMDHGRLFLVGDAAHIITPMGAKGMNLALTDASVLARALTAAVHQGDETGLREYSAVCLRRTWDYQEFSRWYAEMVHEAGDESQPFRRRLALARLDRLFTSPAAATAFADLMAGTDPGQPDGRAD
ncbi:p-hydroxybenzoate 3-monooxygenase [Actinoplanes octamycinicus]|uniref:p-hydroxybenzoate 3-monooxygenase n=1 Tax=Actinoplanes octamycinicus TaxID=135948 RepID=A0A7W7M903_9ACTN|nr:4-hydroxybenzoate 3-monooxygenase [Actinoplanes octamycinicus]MBB4741484.1 p-hydroxybenzoate 3-monooxygenase [Actinoplanes octamycinicus]GIE57034.1 4-hydroxybenzoate 3-monooxygenase [Actinoplanes octamycinicus]